MGGRALLAPARQSVQSPAAVRPTHERAARVALARVATALRVTGADHVLRQLAAVPAALAARRLADDRHVDLVEHRRVASR